MKFYIVNAFTDEIFGGGPAGVVITDAWLSDEVMQNIATEVNLADTAFVVKNDEGYALRWFMPDGEINLNGHATLAASYIIFNYMDAKIKKIDYKTKSGVLEVTREGEYLALNMPAVFNHPTELTPEMVAALGCTPKEAYFGQNLFFVFDKAEEVRTLTPDFGKMKQLPLGQGVFVSAPSDDKESDIVARTFWPKMGVNEDPVCGNMHCNLTPFWSKRLGKKQFVSHQLSRRGAFVVCEDAGDRAILKGKAALFMVGDMKL